MDVDRVAAMLDMTFAFALNRTFSREEAEELTQEILFQAIKSLGGLFDDSKFEPWFWRVADITHKVFKRSRAKQRAIMSYDEVTLPETEDDYAFIRNDEYQGLRRQIAFLSASYRDIIVMHYYDNLSCKVISQKLGLPEGTVTYRLSLARNKLKEGCVQMNETALKPVQLRIRIHGEGEYNGEDKPYPSQYIDDALSQNILWYLYREPKTVEALSSLTGVPAFYIEDRIDNLIKREAVIQPTKKTVQTNFLIIDWEINSYAPAHSGEFADTVSADFCKLSLQLVNKMLSAGLQTAGRSLGEMQCLLSVMLLHKFVPDYSTCEYKRIQRRYDGGLWEYTGFCSDDSNGVSIGMERSMNSYESGKLSHQSYHFTPFTYRKMMYSHEIDICQAVLQRDELTEMQKETAAKLIADGILKADETGQVVCSVPVFTKEQYELFITSAKTIFADFLPLYAEAVKKYLDGYIKLFPKHLKDAAERNGFHVFVALFQTVAANWLRNGLISLPSDAVCDALIMM
jgi:RNA polymerase sigma-70 factor (ECF subfamily)